MISYDEDFEFCANCNGYGLVENHFTGEEEICQECDGEGIIYLECED